MEPIPEGVQVYLAVSVAVAALLHWRIRKYLLACGASALTGPFAFAAVCALFADMPTEFPPLGVFLLFFCISLLISVTVGAPFALVRRIRAQQALQTDAAAQRGLS